ncbi:hypothetical protein F8388_009647 [Cannabis sativa]|uniref:Uncharacterized protein n=1 Tax=Cannabis sativa TaxID=3483 RepID=A0A7J6E8I2_CANSA|nr:hypothetical protein F8388_009647 [Cannabis sativa]KAF4392347.1 hypothetical protein G4B88_005306 [Cannabis sativa]
MDLRLHPNPIQPGKNKPLKPPNKPIQKMPKASIITSTLSRDKRVFGTVRNSNNATIIKPSSSNGVPHKKPQRSKPTRLQPFTENPKPNLKQIEEEKKTPISGHRTPVNSKISASKSNFHTAKICTKCRFDRLETSSYWVGQIKLAESVGKHFASLAFFKLAIESKAQPFEKLDLELKRYLGRNGGLGVENEWKELCSKYEILLLKKKKESGNNYSEDFGSVIKELSLTQTQITNLEVENDDDHHGFCQN